MAAKLKRKKTGSADEDGTARRRRDEDWDERLRLVGDARFTKVEWSGRDNPSWPLPVADEDVP